MATLEELEDAIRVADAAGRREDVLALSDARDKLLRSSPPAEARSLPPVTTLDMVKNSPVGGFARGVMDPAYALAQTGANAFGLFGGQGAESANAAVDAAEKDYTQNWRRGSVDGKIDVSRMLGNTVLPLVVTRGASAAQMPATLFQMAKTGAVAGGGGGILQPVIGAKDPADFFAKKGAQVGAGAVGGAVFNPALVKGAQAGGQFVNSIVNKAKAFLAPRSQVDIELILHNALRDQGLDPAAVSAATMEAMRQDVRAALNQTGAVDPSAVARATDFKEAGIQPIRSWITRDPVQWTQEANLAGIGAPFPGAKPVGEPLQLLKARANNAIVEGIESKSPVGASPDPFARNQAAAGAVQAADDRMSANVDKGYQMFRDFAPTTPGDGARFADSVARRLTVEFALDQLPSDFVRRMQMMSEGSAPTNIRVLYEMRAAANRGLKSGPNHALSVLKDEIDAEMGRIAGAGFSLDVLKAATSMAKNRFDLHDAVPAFKAAAAGELAPDKFFDKYVRGATVGQVARLWSEVGPDAQDALRAQLVGAIKQAAVGSSQHDGAPVAQATLNKFLQQDGMTAKLRIMLGDRHLADIQRLGRIAEAVVKAPAGSNVNVSNTSQAVVNALQRGMSSWASAPLLGKVAGPLSVSLQRAQVNSAMNPGPEAFAARSPWGIPDDRKLRALAGLLSAPTGTIVAGEFSR